MSVHALSPLQSVRAVGTAARYAPALQESRRLPPEQDVHLMGSGMSGWALRAQPVTTPAGTLPFGRLRVTAGIKSLFMRSCPFDALASSLAQGHTLPAPAYGWPGAVNVA